MVTTISEAKGQKEYGVVPTYLFIHLCIALSHWRSLTPHFLGTTHTVFGHIGVSPIHLQLFNVLFQYSSVCACRLVLRGVPVLAAAGNRGASACDASPASSPFAITIGASDYNDQRLQLPEGPGSNYGPCIDIFAPGENILGASANNTTQGVRLSGTSQAVAIAAGAAAMYMHAMPQATPAQLRQALVSAAAVGEISENLPEEFRRLVLEASDQSSALSPPAAIPLTSGSEADSAPPLAEDGEETSSPPDKRDSTNRSRSRIEQPQRLLLDSQGSVVPESPRISSANPGAKRRLDYTSLLQVASLGSMPLVATSPATFLLLPAHNSGLDHLYDVEIVLAQAAKNDVSIIIGEAASLSAESAADGEEDDEHEGEGGTKVVWGAPQRFGGPFSATIPKGETSLALQLPLNESIAMSSIASGAFFLTVMVSSEDDTLEKHVPLQVWLFPHTVSVVLFL